MRGESIVSKIKLSDEQVQQLVKSMQDIDKTKNATPKIHCQYCGSTDVKKISAGNRFISACTFGIAGSKVGKQWHCNNCGSNF